MTYTNPNCTPCTAEQTVLTPCTTGCSVILSDACVIRKGSAIACLGIEVDDTLEEMIDKIAEKVCAADNYIFDTTCLSGSGAVNSNIGDAVNLIITKICDSVVSYPTFNASCLGGDPVETMSNTINYLISAACADPEELTFGSLDWTCLTPAGSSDLSDVLQGLIDNIADNKLSFGTGFTVTPQPCGSLVEFGGSSGITLSTLNASITTGSPTAYIGVTPSSGIHSAFTLQPIYQNGTRAIITPSDTDIENGNIVYGGSISTASYVVHWNNHVSFDGVLVFKSTIMKAVAWVTNTPSEGTFDVFSLGTGSIPDRVKVFPGKLEIKVPALPNPGDEVPEGFCTSFDIKIIVQTIGLGGKLQIVYTDCQDIVSNLELFEAAYPTVDLTADVWLSQVQYYTV